MREDWVWVCYTANMDSLLYSLRTNQLLCSCLNLVVSPQVMLTRKPVKRYKLHECHFVGTGLLSENDSRRSQDPSQGCCCSWGPFRERLEQGQWRGMWISAPSPSPSPIDLPDFCPSNVFIVSLRPTGLKLRCWIEMAFQAIGRSFPSRPPPPLFLLKWCKTLFSSLLFFSFPPCFRFFFFLFLWEVVRNFWVRGKHD